MTETPIERIVDTGVIAVLRGVDGSRAPDVVGAIEAGGVDVVEITADTAGAADIVETIDRTFEGVLVGAGTVLDADTAAAMARAGARFVVSPTVEQAVIETCHRHDVPVIPGAFTPTEVLRAHRAGADLVKVFPASTGGPGHLSALGGPLGHVQLVPTGGVDAGNAGSFIEAGAVAVGVGGAIVDDEAVRAGEFDTVRENARAVLAAVEAARD